MSRPGLGTAVLTASLVITALAGQAAATAAATAPPTAAATLTSTAAGAAGAARATARLAAAAGGLTGRAVFLVTGQWVPAAAAGLAGTHVLTGGPGQGWGSAGPLQIRSEGGTTQVMPAEAAPYAGRGLAPALFEPRALAKAESAGRLPVRLSYSASLPALPGVTITSSAHGIAAGYLTAAGARAFGSALARQYAADHAQASYGRAGILRGVDISLAGTPASVPVTRPAYPMHTLIVTGTDLAGRPDTGDQIELHNVDDLARDGADIPVSVFYHGTARFSVPAGRYYAIASFCCARLSWHLVVVPQFTVGRTAATTTLPVSERSASSRVTFTTPRPAQIQDQDFGLHRVDASGTRSSNEAWGIVGTVGSIWVSPTTNRPAAGTLQSETQATLTSPASVPGTPYAYRLDFPGPGGIIPAQHFSPGPASLATVHERYYQDTKSSGYWCTFGGYVFPDRNFDPSGVFLPIRLPRDQTQYLSAGPSVIWQSSYSWPGGGQTDGFRTYRAGQQLTQDWGAYPLHPQPNAQTAHGHVAADLPVRASAFRIGNTVTLSVTPFSDNFPGHFGTGFAGGRRAGITGSYAIYQNGRRIAHGNPARQISPVRVTGRPSVIRFTLTARRHRPLARLSQASSTTWTWRSWRRPAATIPPAWWCEFDGPRRCAVQPMMTLDYHIRGLALNGTTTAGPQVIRLDAGHIQLGGRARITRVTGWVSFSGGRSWRRAVVTAIGHGHFRIAFAARPGAYVTLRTSATDAAGSSVTETIQRAYQIDRKAPMRAACQRRGARQARCYALYAPQVAVNAAIAARAAGQPAAAGATTPKGWGATSIEQAYQLPVRRSSDATVAVVDAFSTPHLAADLARYRARYHLPPCTTASRCLRIVNQHGQASPLPAADPAGWGVEETLDVSMVSAACPRCKILVVEARSPSFGDLAAAEKTAVRLGAAAISNSYGAPESGYTQVYASAYRHPGHVIVASSGDDGFGPAQFPANLATVTAVGGTELARASNARGWAEKAWNAGIGASASGCSAYVTKPSWQHDPHCPDRTIADVAAVAWNIALYDSSVPDGPWLTTGGTSASAPLIAGLYALAGNAATIQPGYEYARRRALFDITAGNNSLLGDGGTICGRDYLCVAKQGYDAPTGLGTPHGTGAF